MIPNLFLIAALTNVFFNERILKTLIELIYSFFLFLLALIKNKELRKRTKSRGHRHLLRQSLMTGGVLQVMAITI